VQKKILIRFFIILIIAVIFGIADLPNSALNNLPNFGIIKWAKEQKIHLGLDLQGGTQLDYKIDLRKVSEKDTNAITEGVREVIEKRVNKIGVSEPNIYLSQIADEHHIVIELAGIKDLEEAKKTVGKTIQLEFKEKKEALDPQEKIKIEANFRNTLTKITEGGNFKTVGEEIMNPPKAIYEEMDFKFADELPKEFQEDISKLNPNEFTQKITEATDGYTIAEGEIQPKTGFIAYQLLEKKEEEREIKQEKEVKASHILIAFKGAERANEKITRTEAEAQTLAKEILAKAQANEDFAKLAKKYTDEPGGADRGGDLGFFKKGAMVPQFEAAAFATEKNKIYSDIVKTQFGFHVIKVIDIKEAKEEKKLEPKLKLAKIFFSTVPDPWKETELNGKFFEHADVQFDPNTYSPYVSIKFNVEGAQLFEKITERNINKPLAIFVGGELISAPRVNEKISGGSAQISGRFSMEEASILARDLNTGAIPAPILLRGQHTIGATLGQDALTKSVKAGILGFILLTIYMIAYYRLMGLVAISALGVYGITLLFIIKMWPALLGGPIILTLAGVAGVILSIGMAVDANILIFERFKEEIRSGKTLISSVETGFDRAWTSIRDSNVSSLITCAILFWFGSSIIRGFALTLSFGIIISMFSAISVSRIFLLILTGTKIGQLPWMYGIKTVTTTEEAIISTNRVQHISSTQQNEQKLSRAERRRLKEKQ